MKRITSTFNGTAAKLASCALLAASFSSVAMADGWDRKTSLTFSGPVEIPGQILQAGKYTFRLVDSSSNRHIVQISNERQDRVYATVLAIPVYRQNPPNETKINFYEARAGEAPPIRNWFYPGDTMGNEFIYSKDRANTLLSTNRTVNTIETVASAAPATDRSTAAASSDAVAAAEGADTIAAQEGVQTPNTPAPVSENVDGYASAVTAMNDESNQANAIAQNEAVQEAQAPASTPDTPAEMPKTASQLALAGLLGIGSLAAAYSVRKAS